MIKGLNHVGLSVANLDRAITFYRDAFGMRVIAQREFGGEFDATILALRNANGRVATVAAGNLELELFEFHSPEPKSSLPNRPVCDHGISHFCVEVTDIHAEYQRMQAAGASFHCPPLEFPGRVLATYGRDLDGNVFEIVEIVAR